MENTDFGATQPAFKSQLCRLAAVYDVSMLLNFLGHSPFNWSYYIVRLS